VVLPRISNFTDLDALGVEPGLDVSFTDSPRGLAAADLVVLPGTRTTIADLAWLREAGLADAVVAHARGGGAVLGICGGFQMLGREVFDLDGVEEPPGTRVSGLGLLDVSTTFTAEKRLQLSTGRVLGVEAAGYQIHHGRVRVRSGEPFLEGVRDGMVFGTMWHGSLEGDAFRHRFMDEVARAARLDGGVDGTGSFEDEREHRLELLAALVEDHIDMERILELIANGAPSTLPTIRGGLA
jgi:adenosylcobyric acid synthase